MFNSNCSTALTMPVAPVGYGYGYGNGGGMFGNDSDLLALIILFALFGGNGFGFGGFGFGGGAGLQGMATRADINEGFALQNITGGIQSIQQGICDSTYALNNSITNGFYGLQSQLADCCCGTQRAIDGVNYNMAKGFCDLSNVLNNSTRDILESNNANTRAILDFMVQSKMDEKDSKISELQSEVMLSKQNAYLTANQEAQTATLIRRLGADCPVPAYVVPNPNCCYNPFGFGYGGYGNSGCGCGCA